MIASTGAVFTVRFQAAKSSNGAPSPDTQNLPSPSPPPPRTPLLSVPKPSWIVKSESNVRFEERRNPDPPYAEAVAEWKRLDRPKSLFVLTVSDSFFHYLVGRTKNVDLAMLPKGEWPKWCKTCCGSLGTGEYRYLMGFHFMKKDQDQTQDRDMLKTRKSAQDLLS